MPRENRAAPSGPAADDRAVLSAAPGAAAGPSVYTDSHAHLSLVESRLGGACVEAMLSAYAGAWEQEIRSGLEASAPFILDIGVNPGDLELRLQRFGRYPFVRFTAGLWPGRESLDRPNEALAELKKDLASPRCGALGECGLDYHHMEAPRSEQMRLFASQAAMAEELGLPLVVHSRDAFEDTLAVVSGVASSIPVIIHCFGYGAREAEKFLETGCLLSFAGNLTYKKSDGLRSALAITPPDRLLIETDSPYMNPMPRRGKDATSLDIARTIELAARLKNVSVAELSAAAQANAFRIFSGKRRRGEALPS
ncbi:MAG TPA: TatD family hydrolase [Rectinemataceae bacterium]|nr:TatD family hydrolase [Rectinemataceae bacterium]